MSFFSSSSESSRVSLGLLYFLPPGLGDTEIYQTRNANCPDTVLKYVMTASGVEKG